MLFSKETDCVSDALIGPGIRMFCYGVLQGKLATLQRIATAADRLPPQLSPPTATLVPSPPNSAALLDTHFVAA